MVWPLTWQSRARDAQAGVGALAVVGGVELFLQERRHQEAEAVELDRRDDVLEEPVEVVDRDHLAPRDVAQLGPGELQVEALQAREHLDLDRREDLAPGRLPGGAAGPGRGTPSWPGSRRVSWRPADPSSCRWRAARSGPPRAALQPLALRRGHARPGVDVGLHDLLEGLLGLLGVERVTREIEAPDVPAVRLAGPGIGGGWRRRLGRIRASDRAPSCAAPVGSRAPGSTAGRPGPRRRAVARRGSARPRTRSRSRRVHRPR